MNRTVYVSQQKDYYCDTTTPEFQAYLKTVDLQHFAIKPELLKYCHKDVRVLFKCVQKFTMECKEISDKIHPIIHTSGLASLCSFVYRLHHMPAESIQIIGDADFTGNVSKLSTKYISWLNNQKLGDYQYSENGGEVTVTGRITADGYDRGNFVNERPL